MDIYELNAAVDLYFKKKACEDALTKEPSHSFSGVFYSHIWRNDVTKPVILPEEVMDEIKAVIERYRDMYNQRIKDL